MKIGVLTSGGDAPGMNAAIRAVVRRAFNLNCECVGYLHGFNGLINGEWRKMTQASVAGIIQRGGTILRTARSAEFHTAEGRDMAIETLARTGVEGLVVIGGGGSALGAMGLDGMGIPVVSVPSTVDNDLLGTDVTIGHMSAVDTVVQNVNRVRDTATSHERIFVIETMGRDTGHIALDAGLAVRRRVDPGARDRGPAGGCQPAHPPRPRQGQVAQHHHDGRGLRTRLRRRPPDPRRRPSWRPG